MSKHSVSIWASHQSDRIWPHPWLHIVAFSSPPECSCPVYRWPPDQRNFAWLSNLSRNLQRTYFCHVPETHHCSCRTVPNIPKEKKSVDHWLLLERHIFERYLSRMGIDLRYLTVIWWCHSRGSATKSQAQRKRQGENRQVLHTSALSSSAGKEGDVKPHNLLLTFICLSAPFRDGLVLITVDHIPFRWEERGGRLNSEVVSTRLTFWGLQRTSWYTFFPPTKLCLYSLYSLLNCTYGILSMAVQLIIN